MKKIKIWIVRIVLIAVLATAVIKSPTAFASTLLGVILAGYLLYLWLKWKFWRFLKPLGEMNEAISSTTLNLQKSSKPFYTPEQVHAGIETLKRNGFAILGTYVAKQLPSTNLVLANNQQEGVHALIIDQEYMGVITEFCSRYDGEKSFTYSNTKMPAIMPRHPNHPITRLPDVDAQTVLDEFKKSRPQSDMVTLKDEEVQPMIELMFNELKVYEVEAVQKSVDTENQLLENFIVASGWTALEWHRKQNNIIIIHDEIKDYELISKFEAAINDEDARYQKMKSQAESIAKNNSPLKAFEILTIQVPTAVKVKKICELTDPVPAHVYITEKAKG